MNLGGAIGELLPSAVGVAISPIPIIAAVLMLMSARARQTAPAFAAGWLAGLVVVGAIVLLVANPADVSGGGSGSTVVGWVKVVLGLLFLVMAAGQWRRRPRAGDQAAMPGWMRAIDTMPAGRAFALAAALAAVNPKNLALTLAGALSIAQAGLSTGQSVVALAVFVVVAGCSVAGPVVGYLLFRERVEQPLLHAKDWLARENATVMFVVLLVLGVVVLGKGIGVVTA
jgi:hypothetical protein